MFKAMAFICLMSIICITAACGGSGPDDVQTPTPAETAAAVDSPTEAANPTPTPIAVKNADGFVFTVNGTHVYMDENMEDVLTRLGEPRRVFEAPSCAFEGIDRIFSFQGYDLHTYPENEQDFVHTVNFRDDSLATPEGVFLGGSLSDMLAAYGDDYEQELGQYKYTKGQTYLSFIIDEDEIVAIMYGLTLYFN